MKKKLTQVFSNSEKFNGQKQRRRGTEPVIGDDGAASVAAASGEETEFTNKKVNDCSNREKTTVLSYPTQRPFLRFFFH